MQKEKDILMTFDKDRLVTLVIDLLERLEDGERIQFISRNIDPKLALLSIDEGDGLGFLKKVKEFCKACLNGDYYVEPEYNDYWDNYDDDAFEDCEWSESFAEYLNTAVMYSRNEDYDIAFEALELLLNCIKETEADEEILGTESPMDYIEVDWNDIFKQYYLCIVNCIKDEEKMAHKAFEVWLNFDEMYTENILDHIEDLSLMENVIREKTEKFTDWGMQHAFFELLRSFYEKYNNGFDRIKLAESFLVYNPNFYYEVVKAYVELKDWEKAIDTIKAALPKIEMEDMKLSLKNTLVDCYENLNEFQKAFDTAKELFYGKLSYAHYKRARYFAQKINVQKIFTDEVIKTLSLKNEYPATQILMWIFSYEGFAEKLLEFVRRLAGYTQYYDLKYASRSLVYRAFHGENTEFANLKDFIESIEQAKEDGIVDMEVTPEDTDKREFYLTEAVNILKEMVEFHIAAATRTRYEKAAYYCGVVKDIYSFLKRPQEFDTYYDNIIDANRRRPALKDEMKKKIGR